MVEQISYNHQKPSKTNQYALTVTLTNPHLEIYPEQYRVLRMAYRAAADAEDHRVILHYAGLGLISLAALTHGAGLLEQFNITDIPNVTDTELCTATRFLVAGYILCQIFKFSGIGYIMARHLETISDTLDVELTRYESGEKRIKPPQDQNYY